MELKDIRLLGNKVIVRVLPTPTKYKGFYIPQKPVGKFDVGEVAVLGEKFSDKEIKVGDFVMFSIYAGVVNAEIDVNDNQDYIILNCADLWARLDNYNVETGLV